MALLMTDIKVPQDRGFMRLNSNIAAFSQKEVRIPIEDAFKPYVSSEISKDDMSRPMINLPTNRVFGFFPMSKGTLLSNKGYLHGLVNGDVYGVELEGVPVNDQRQLTNQEVAGLNIQRNLDHNLRFPNYPGNAKAKYSRDVSKVKHAENAMESDVAAYIAMQLEQLRHNPLVVETMKRAQEIANKVSRKI